MCASQILIYLLGNLLYKPFLQSALFFLMLSFFETTFTAATREGFAMNVESTLLQEIQSFQQKQYQRLQIHYTGLITKPGELTNGT